MALGQSTRHPHAKRDCGLKRIFRFASLSRRRETEKRYVPGVMGGDAELVHSSLTSISEKTSSSHPAFIPSIFWEWKPPLTGVGRISALDGGLLIALPEDERGGVEGA